MTHTLNMIWCNKVQTVYYNNRERQKVHFSIAIPVVLLFEYILPTLRVESSYQDLRSRQRQQATKLYSN